MKQQKQIAMPKRFYVSRLAACCLLLHSSLTWSASIQRVSTSAANAEVNGNNRMPSMTPNGRYVLFYSDATNLVDNDYNGAMDVFLKDRKTGKVTRVSTNASGGEGDGGSTNIVNAAITPNARYAVFQSYATNLVADDNNSVSDIFRKDLKTGALTRVSTNSQSLEADGLSSSASISANGRYVAFSSDATNLVDNDSNMASDIFLKDLKTGKVKRVSTDSLGLQADGYSSRPVVSPNGRYVVFESAASNLVENDTNGKLDIFLKDLKTGKTTRVSTTDQNGEAILDSYEATLTANGRYVVFSSDADNLVANDGNGVSDIFLKDLKTGAITRASTDAQGQEGNSYSRESAVTANGRFVLFESGASNLVSNDSNARYDIFLKDLKTGNVTRLSTASNGFQADNDSFYPSLTPNGRFVSFYSFATNLVSGDNNGFGDVFVYDAKGKP